MDGISYRQSFLLVCFMPSVCDCEEYPHSLNLWLNITVLLSNNSSVEHISFIHKNCPTGMFSIRLQGCDDRACNKVFVAVDFLKSHVQNHQQEISHKKNPG